MAFQSVKRQLLRCQTGGKPDRWFCAPARHQRIDDAHHVIAPHPEGLGAKLAMQTALISRFKPADIDYLNLHGTATPANDAAEGRSGYRALWQSGRV